MPSRREVLRAASLGAGALCLGACGRARAGLAELLGGGIPEDAPPPAGATVDSAHHLLSRAAFGPWPGDVARVHAMGAEAWIDEQLAPADLDDSACEVRVAGMEAIDWPELAFELRPEHVERQLVVHAVLRATYSRRQLAEVMTGLWTDHFNVSTGKDGCAPRLPAHDAEVVRPHALGRFRDLLGAVTRSAAMLVYLDGADNRADGDHVPNENHARELLELHALGVDGGYTQRDVMEAARCMTGWTVGSRRSPSAVRFDATRHDDGEKVVLGRRLPAGGGADDLDRLLDVVIAHPSCARHVGRAICRRLVSDDPPAAVVDLAARAFRDHDGEIAPVVKAVLSSDEMRASAGAKTKRPFRFVVSALRALGAETDGRAIAGPLTAMGQRPFGHPTPDGYPAEAEPWLGTLLQRFRFALDLAHGRAARVDLPRIGRALGGPDPVTAMGRHLLGRDLAPRERAALSTEPRGGRGAGADLVALVLSSPAYQRH